MNEITIEKLDKYFGVTNEAFGAAKASKSRILEHARADFLDMIGRYISDAGHFKGKGDFINAFAALNYAHGWLDAGARLGIFDVSNSRLFTVDEK
ncbi:MAG: DUF357 domain-containing protein [archaeon]